MSIIIKGMEMPDGCDSCKLNANGRGCSITGTKYESDTMVLMDFDEYTQRLKDCPLVELPQHGDLHIKDGEVIEQQSG